MKPADKSTVRFADSWASVHFDLLRGVAAILVLLEHWRNLFFVDFPEIIAHRGWFALPYVLSSAGHQSVVCFFILSGYFIGGTVFRSVQRRQWKWGGYLLRRLVRLWIVLLPTLLLCLLWDHLGITLGHSPALYSGHVNNHIIGDVPSLLTPRIFVGNLFFVQTILTPVFGTDGALWSLAYEFWYYILFPLAVLCFWRSTTIVQRMACGLLFAITAWFVRGPILEYFPMWLAGAALFKVPAPRFAPRIGHTVRLIATAIYFAIFFVIGHRHELPPLLNDYILATATLIYLWILLSHREAFRPTQLHVRASRETARFSFTLYAAHTPILVLLVSLLLGDSRWYPTPIHLLAGFGILIAVLGFAWGLAFITEFRTDSVRIGIEKLLGMSSTAPDLPSNPLVAPSVSDSRQ